jgi:DNA-directed RNA polymerase subunit RPC12/RpoP
MRFICRRCLRLWSADRAEGRAACRYCGGALSPHDRV